MPNIRRLVERVADALGPHTPPERIESVVAAVLDALDDGTTFSPTASPPEDRAIITAYGIDKPGILAAITQDVSDAGCNILDVSQKILQGYFTLIMLADTAPMRGSMADLQQRLTATGDRLQVRIMAQHANLFTAMHRV